VNPKRFLQVVAGNALALSAVYLAIGVLVEGLRVQWPSSAVMRVSYALDALPARVLGRLGLLGPLKEAYTDGRIGESMVRLVFGVTAVGFVFVLALGLAAMTLLVREIVIRRRRPVEP
jgi:ABC-type glucose/galactose transport system permease subunit